MGFLDTIYAGLSHRVREQSVADWRGGEASARVVERDTPLPATHDEPPWQAQGRAWDRGYKPYSTVSEVESDIDWHTASKRSEQLWRQTPLGKRVNETPHALVLSREVDITAEDNPAALAETDPAWQDTQPGTPRWTVQEILDSFWQRNQMRTKLWDLELSLRVRGTEFLPVFVRRTDGRVRLRGFGGRILDLVEDGDDFEDLLAVQASVRGEYGPTEAIYRVISLVDDPDSEYDGMYLGLTEWDESGAGTDIHGDFYDGMGFCFRINRLTRYKWGWPSALHVLDHIDQSDDFFFDMLERVYWLSAIVWKWVFEGANWNELTPGGKFHNFVLRNPPRAGSNLLLNQRASVEPISADLRSEDMMTYTQIIVTVVGALGFGISPVHFGIGEGANRAISREQGHPTRRIYEAEQSLVAARWTRVCDFVLDSAIRAGRLPARDSETGRNMRWNYSIDLPSMDVRDLAAQAQIIKTVAEATTAASMLGLPFDAQTWTNVIAKAVSEYGTDVVLAEEGRGVAEAADRLADRLGGLWRPHLQDRTTSQGELEDRMVSAMAATIVDELQRRAS